ncbi:MAG: S8 family serine peptidase, partial [Anaerolineales bacterium]|nr:S8 family serine peptidase [Anaerolineales bacterium]
FGFQVIQHFEFIDVYQIQLPASASVMGAIADLANNRLIEYVVPNSYHYLDAIPNDTDFSLLYGLNNTGQTGGTSDADIDAPEAWDITTGSHNVVVAVIDSGMDLTHPDLAANLWTNPGEIAANGIDDDGNGFVDDVHGWDFSSNDNDPSPAGGGCVGHGTHVAGTIGAVGNNGTGVAGVSWNVSIMPLKAFRPVLGILCSASDAALLGAIQYHTLMGVPISSNSWGGGGYNQVTFDAIRASHALFVAAAGNSSADNDAAPHYPSSYLLDNIVAVASTDAADNLSSFSSYGATSVDLAAPGSDIYSTLPGGYGYLSGTSMATPHVSGAAALLLAQDPNLTTNELKWRLLKGTDSAGLPVLTNGRLNAYNSLQYGLTTPDVTVSMVPQGPTNVPVGGTLSYEASITNNTGSALSVSVKVYARLKNGVELVRVGPATVNLNPGQTITRTFSETLPGGFTGTFELIGQAQTTNSFDEAVINYSVP